MSPYRKIRLAVSTLLVLLGGVVPGVASAKHPCVDGDPCSCCHGYECDALGCNDAGAGDTDVDTDVDTDTDTGSETDTGTGPDADTDVDADTDADTDADADADADGGGGGSSGCGCRTANAPGAGIALSALVGLALLRPCRRAASRGRARHRGSDAPRRR